MAALNAEITHLRGQVQQLTNERNVLKGQPAFAGAGPLQGGPAAPTSPASGGDAPAGPQQRAVLPDGRLSYMSTAAGLTVDPGALVEKLRSLVNGLVAEALVTQHQRPAGQPPTPGSPFPQHQHPFPNSERPSYANVQGAKLHIPQHLAAMGRLSMRPAWGDAAQLPTPSPMAAVTATPADSQANGMRVGLPGVMMHIVPTPPMPLGAYPAPVPPADGKTPAAPSPAAMPPAGAAAPAVLELNVDGTTVFVERAVLESQAAGSRLHQALVTEYGKLPLDSRGRPYLSYDPRVFQVLLSHLKERHLFGSAAAAAGESLRDWSRTAESLGVSPRYFAQVASHFGMAFQVPPPQQQQEQQQQQQGDAASAATHAPQIAPVASAGPIAAAGSISAAPSVASVAPIGAAASIASTTSVNFMPTVISAHISTTNSAAPAAPITSSFPDFPTASVPSTMSITSVASNVPINPATYAAPIITAPSSASIAPVASAAHVATAASVAATASIGPIATFPTSASIAAADPTATVPSSASIAAAGSIPTVPSSASIAAAGSVPTVPSSASIAAAGSIPTVPSSASIAAAGSVPTVPSSASIAANGSIPTVPSSASIAAAGSVPTVPSSASIAAAGSIPTVPSSASIAAAGSVAPAAPVLSAIASADHLASPTSQPSLTAAAQSLTQQPSTSTGISPRASQQQVPTTEPAQGDLLSDLSAVPSEPSAAIEQAPSAAAVAEAASLTVAPSAPEGQPWSQLPSLRVPLQPRDSRGSVSAGGARSSIGSVRQLASAAVEGSLSREVPSITSQGSAPAPSRIPPPPLSQKPAAAAAAAEAADAAAVAPTASVGGLAPSAGSQESSVAVPDGWQPFSDEPVQGATSFVAASPAASLTHAVSGQAPAVPESGGSVLSGEVALPSLNSAASAAAAAAAPPPPAELEADDGSSA
ncbi:hypothetical protein PLESTF_000714300 [Pleodorina starrii]|nr:hypothetical protein PLESTF_000714300 [Pleodorina starrii]